MKKTILFALLGAVILFAWQFISFAMPNFHKASAEYTPLQDEVLAALDDSGLKEGMYMLGQPDPELSGDAYKQAMEVYEGKPWAVLNFQMNNSSAMTMNMIRSFIMMILISWIFLWFIRQQKDPTLFKRILAGLAVGFIGFCFVPYSSFIWFKEPDIWAFLLDAAVPWIVLGWLGHKMT